MFFHLTILHYLSIYNKTSEGYVTCNVLGKGEKGLLSWEVGVVFSLFSPLGLCLCLPPLVWALEGWSLWSTSSTLACPLISVRSQP